ncbi:MAG: hypothetical protein ACKOWJ_00415 [Micrococcales bacterium]
MAKKIETAAPATDSPYIHEDAPKQPWMKTKQGKLATKIAGAALILGATFAGGVQVGEHFGNDGRGAFAQFGDRDHGFPGQNGQFQRPGGDDQNGQFQGPGGFNPNQQGGVNGQTGTNGSTNGTTGTNP